MAAPQPTQTNNCSTKNKVNWQQYNEVKQNKQQQHTMCTRQPNRTTSNACHARRRCPLSMRGSSLGAIKQVLKGGLWPPVAVRRPGHPQTCSCLVTMQALQLLCHSAGVILVLEVLLHLTPHRLVVRVLHEKEVGRQNFVRHSMTLSDICH